MPVATEKMEERWEALWEVSPQRSPFSRLSYLREVSAAAGLELSVHLIEDDYEIVAGAAVTWKRRGPYRMAVLPPLTPVSALLLRHPPAASDVHARSSSFGRLLRELEAAYDGIHLRLHPTITDVRPAVWGDWEAYPLYTYVLPVPATADVTDGWSASSVRNYHSARESYEVVEGPEAAAAAVTLCVESYARHGSEAPLSAQALRRLVGGTSQISEAFAVRHCEDAGRIDAAVVTLEASGRAYYWIAGSRPGRAMTVLVGELLGRLQRDNVDEFDLVGANTPSIAEFKRRFGSKLETYFGISFYRRRDLELLQVVRRLIRR